MAMLELLGSLASTLLCLAKIPPRGLRRTASLSSAEGSGELGQLCLATMEAVRLDGLPLLTGLMSMARRAVGSGLAHSTATVCTEMQQKRKGAALAALAAIR